MDIDKSNMTRNNIIDNDEIKAINAGLDINNPPNVVEVMVVVVDEIVVAVDDSGVVVVFEIFGQFWLEESNLNFVVLAVVTLGVVVVVARFDKIYISA